MLDAFAALNAVVHAESLQADFVAMTIIVLWVGLGSLIHEIGHMTAARLCGIKGGTFVFRPLNGKRGLPFPAFDINNSQLFSVSRTARRFIFAGGAIADALITLFVWSVFPHLTSPSGIVVGIFCGVTLRGMVLWGNLIPLSSIRTDGWRILNPDSPI
ncbi:RIP metalloprotease [Rugamonas aquatica]|uniref:Peptidase M50 domain-containing protein n=1 Tax=Rugamonas aquatica TaxID=2743357 RepID=A0A6A7N1U0_9BURK|nr:hypothetical protein [Rugamonas aquatica]MQA38890.1 hypothetical protein [Rugamonas aquatica]